VRGVSLKIGHRLQLRGEQYRKWSWGRYSYICGAYVYLKWIKPSELYNVEQATRQIMAWFPKKHRGELNEVYAGLGQLLLQMRDDKDKVKDKMRALSKKTNNVMVARMVEEILSIPEYDK